MLRPNSSHYLTGKLNEVDKLYKWILDGFEQFYGFSHPETLSVLIACTDLSYEIFKLNALKSEKADTIVVSKYGILIVCATQHELFLIT